MYKFEQIIEILNSKMKKKIFIFGLDALFKNIIYIKKISMAKYKYMKIWLKKIYIRKIVYLEKK